MPRQVDTAIALTAHAEPLPLLTAAGSWDGVISAYLIEVAQRTGSKRTPAEYQRHIDRFRTLICPDLSRATAAEVHTFGYAALPHRRRDGVTVEGTSPSPSTTIVRLAALRGLFDFARRHGLIERNPVDDVKRPRMHAAAPKGLSRAQVRALLDAIPNSPAGQRDRAVIVLMLLTGARREEALELRASSIREDDEGFLTFTTRVKGGRVRRRELPRPAYAAILEALHAQGVTLDEMAPDDPIFQLQSNSFYANLRRYAQRANLSNVTPHALRHSAAKLRRETGATIEEVQALLGHASIATTANYLRQLEGTRDPGWESAAAAIGL